MTLDYLIRPKNNICELRIKSYNKSRIKRKVDIMKINRKIMMISIIALMSFTPLMSIVTSSNGREVVEAAAIIYHTVGQNRIKVVKNTNFVNAQGTKQSAGAERGVSYPIYAIKNINGVPYLSVQKSNRYWLPVSAIKGTVTYKKDSFILLPLIIIKRK